MRESSNWKFFAFFTTCLLSVFACGLAFGATVTLDEEYAEPGALEFPLSLHLSTDAGDEVCGIQLDLSFDSETMTFAGALLGTTAEDAGKDVSYSSLETGVVRIIIAGFNQLQMPNGVLADLLIDVHAQAAPGLHAVAIDMLLISDPFGTAVPSDFISGGILIDGGEGEGEGEIPKGTSCNASGNGADRGQVGDIFILLLMMATLISKNKHGLVAHLHRC